MSRQDLLHAVERGPNTGPALVLLHPLGADQSFWDECAAIWSKRWRTIAVDLRGAGRSAAPDRPWTAADQVRELIAICDALKIEDVVLIGCAIGSLVAVKLAAALGLRVMGLVLSDTAPELGEASRSRTQGRVDLVRREGLEALLPGVIDLAFEKQPRDERYSRYMAMFRRNTVEGYAAIALGMMGADLKPDLQELSCPALVTVGQHDTLLPPQLSEAVHTRLRGSEFVLMETAAHFAPYQAPVEFAALVTDFLHRRVFASP